MAKKKKEPVWLTKSITSNTAGLIDDVPYQKALEQIDRTDESAGMKHLLIGWAAQERLEDRKLPEKLLSRKRSTSFRDFTRKQMIEDRGTFRLSGITTAFAMVLLCSFIRNAIFGKYLVNFSVDAVVAAIGAALAILNLRTQLQTAELYGNTRPMVLTDVLALVLWFLMMQVFRNFDSSIVIFLVTYFFSLWRFKKMQEKFIQENHLEISLNAKK